MVTREHRTRAAALLRIIAAYDGREYDDFIVTAFATGVAKYEHIPDADWQAAITDWYLTPGVRRITVGDLCAAAVKTYRTRTKADTIGELGLLYRLAPVVFIGGSLIRHGGQNPIEAAKLGAAILHGPNVANFAEIYRALDSVRGAGLDMNIIASHGCDAICHALRRLYP